VLHGVKQERNIINATKQRKVHCTGHTLFRNGLLRHSIEGNKRKDRGTGRRGRKVSTYWMTVRKEEDIGN
jgi:hypothetical protein